SLRPREEPLPLLRPVPELPQPLTGTEQDLMEAFRLDLQVRADLLFAVLREVEAEEELAVAVVAELVEKPPHLPCFLVGKDPVEGSRAAIGENGLRASPPLVLLPAVVQGAVARLLAPVGDEQVARRAADESGELVGLPHLSVADLFEHQRERLL